MPSNSDLIPGRRIAVSALYIYPVKSLGGIAVSRAVVGERGFLHDRRWMIVDDQGAFLTQRTHPGMALVKASLHDDSIALEDADGRQEGTSLPLETGGTDVQVQVWGDAVVACWPRLPADAWISALLGVDCRFVYMPEKTGRMADVRYYPRKSRVSFADAFPYLLTSEGSLVDLNGRSGATLDIRRFRPNIVVSGNDAYEEDLWASIRIGGVVFHLVKACARCAVTTLDPDTAVRGVEPLRTLAMYRNENSKTLFGQNMVSEGSGTIAVGDPVEVVAWKNG